MFVTGIAVSSRDSELCLLQELAGVSSKDSELCLLQEVEWPAEILNFVYFDEK